MHLVARGAAEFGGARSLAIGDPRGRLKAVVNQADGEILGFHILAPHGGDLLHEVVAAMHDHGRIERIGKSVHAHPTLSEMVKAAAKAADMTRKRGDYAIEDVREAGAPSLSRTGATIPSSWWRSASSRSTPWISGAPRRPSPSV